MAFKGEQSVIADHAATVVGDQNQLFAAALDLHFDASGPGIQRVFQKLFEHGSRTLRLLGSGPDAG